MKVSKVPGVLRDEQQTRYDELKDTHWWNLEEDEKADKEALEEILEGDYSDEQRSLSGIVAYVTSRGDVSCVVGLVTAGNAKRQLMRGSSNPTKFWRQNERRRRPQRQMPSRHTPIALSRT